MASLSTTNKLFRFVTKGEKYPDYARVHPGTGLHPMKLYLDMVEEAAVDPSQVADLVSRNKMGIHCAEMIAAALPMEKGEQLLDLLGVKDVFSANDWNLTGKSGLDYKSQVAYSSFVSTVGYRSFQNVDIVAVDITERSVQAVHFNRAWNWNKYYIPCDAGGVQASAKEIVRWVLTRPRNRPICILYNKPEHLGVWLAAAKDVSNIYFGSWYRAVSVMTVGIEPAKQMEFAKTYDTAESFLSRPRWIFNKYSNERNESLDKYPLVERMRYSVGCINYGNLVSDNVQYGVQYANEFIYMVRDRRAPTKAPSRDARKDDDLVNLDNVFEGFKYNIETGYRISEEGVQIVVEQDK